MIYAISGKRGAGKSSAAAHLMKKYGFVRVSFADELKRQAQLLFPFSLKDFVIPKLKEAPFGEYDWSPREFLVHYGEFMRFHDKDYWLKRGLALCTDPKKNYVFDDCRYINEAEAIKKAGGKVVRINRYEKKNPYGKNLDTPSETELDNYTFDFTVPEVRNTSLLELQTQMDAMVAQWT